MTRQSPDLNGPNPFIDNEDDVMIHPMLQQEIASLPKVKPIVNAFIKVRWSPIEPEPKNMLSTMPLRELATVAPRKQAGTSNDLNPQTLLSRTVTHLPPQFGDAPISHALDRKLFEFCEYNFSLQSRCKLTWNAKSRAPSAQAEQLLKQTIRTSMR